MEESGAAAACPNNELVDELVDMPGCFPNPPNVGAAAGAPPKPMVVEPVDPKAEGAAVVEAEPPNIPVDPLNNDPVEVGAGVVPNGVLPPNASFGAAAMVLVVVGGSKVNIPRLAAAPPSVVVVPTSPPKESGFLSELPPKSGAAVVVEVVESAGFPKRDVLPALKMLFEDVDAGVDPKSPDFGASVVEEVAPNDRAGVTFGASAAGFGADPPNRDPPNGGIVEAVEEAEDPPNRDPEDVSDGAPDEAPKRLGFGASVSAGFGACEPKRLVDEDPPNIGTVEVAGATTGGFSAGFGRLPKSDPTGVSFGTSRRFEVVIGAAGVGAEVGAGAATGATGAGVGAAIETTGAGAALATGAENPKAGAAGADEAGASEVLGAPKPNAGFGALEPTPKDTAGVVEAVGLKARAPNTLELAAAPAADGYLT